MKAASGGATRAASLAAVSVVLAVLLLGMFANQAWADACPAGGEHDYRWSVALAPTETEDGLREGVCAKCGDVYDVVMPKTGHTWSDWETVQAPTCTQSGLQQRVCVKYPDNPHYEYQTLAPLSDTGEHAWVETARVEPTCEQEGQATFTCSVCGEQRTEVLPALGHEWGAWHTTLAASAQHAGTEERACVRDATHVETRELPIEDVEPSPDETTEKMYSHIQPAPTRAPVRLFAEDFWTASPTAVDAAMVSVGGGVSVLFAVLVLVPFFAELAWVRSRRREARRLYWEREQEKVEEKAEAKKRTKG